MESNVEGATGPCCPHPWSCPGFSMDTGLPSVVEGTREDLGSISEGLRITSRQTWSGYDRRRSIFIKRAQARLESADFAPDLCAFTCREAAQNIPLQGSLLCGNKTDASSLSRSFNSQHNRPILFSIISLVQGEVCCCLDFSKPARLCRRQGLEFCCRASRHVTQRRLQGALGLLEMPRKFPHVVIILAFVLTSWLDRPYVSHVSQLFLRNHVLRGIWHIIIILYCMNMPGRGAQLKIKRMIFDVSYMLLYRKIVYFHIISNEINLLAETKLDKKRSYVDLVSSFDSITKVYASHLYILKVCFAANGGSLWAEPYPQVASGLKLFCSFCKENPKNKNSTFTTFPLSLKGTSAYFHLPPLFRLHYHYSKHVPRLIINPHSLLNIVTIYAHMCKTTCKIVREIITYLRFADGILQRFTANLYSVTYTATIFFHHSYRFLTIFKNCQNLCCSHVKALHPSPWTAGYNPTVQRVDFIPHQHNMQLSTPSNYVEGPARCKPTCAMPNRILYFDRARTKLYLLMVIFVHVFPTMSMALSTDEAHKMNFDIQRSSRSYSNLKSLLQDSRSFSEFEQAFELEGDSLFVDAETQIKISATHWGIILTPLKLSLRPERRIIGNFIATAITVLLTDKPQRALIYRLEDLWTFLFALLESSRFTSEIQGIIITLSFLLYLLKTHDLLHRGKRCFEKCRHLTSMFPPPWKSALSPNGNPTKKLTVLYEIFFMQLSAIFLPCDRSPQTAYLYTVETNGASYIGRTNHFRSNLRMNPGPFVRFFEHFRSIRRILRRGPEDSNSLPADLKRYVGFGLKQLKPVHFLIFCQCTKPYAARYETVAIALAKPKVNDMSSKRMDNLCQPKIRQPREGKHRNRLHLARRRKQVFPYERDQNPGYLEPDALWKTQFNSYVERDFKYDNFFGFLKVALSRNAMSFQKLYRDEQKVFSLVGPLDIYDKLHPALLLRYLADPKGFVSLLHLVERRNKKVDFLYLVEQDAVFLPVPHHRSAVIMKIDEVLRTYGFPTAKHLPIKCAHQSFVPDVKVWIKKMCHCVRPSFPYLSRHLRRSTHIITSAALTWRKKKINISRRLQDAKFADLFRLTPFESTLIGQSRDLMRISSTMKVNLQHDQSEATQCTYDECRRWVNNLPLTDLPAQLRHYNPVLCYTTDTAMQHVQRDILGMPFSLLDRLEEIEIPGLEWCMTVEDKDPSAAWLSTTLGMLERMLVQVSKSQGRWISASLDHESVRNVYRSIVDAAVPRKHSSGLGAIAARQIPYAYATVKRKCWTDQNLSNPINSDTGEVQTFCERHKCEKPSHSWLRTIVSFIHTPHRLCFRRYSRALTHLTDALFDHASIRQPAKFVPHLKQSLLNLKREDVCIACKCKLHEPSIRTADAGQAYEAVPHRLVLDILEQTKKKVNSRDFPAYVGVKKQAKSDTFLQHTSRPQVGCSIYSVNLVVQACILMTFTRFYRLANIYLIQLEGLPIGGLLSGAILDHILSHLEDRWWRCGFRAWLTKVGGNTEAFDALVNKKRALFIGRYVDDTLAVSRMLCSTCLDKAIVEIYAQAINFEENTEVHEFNLRSYTICLDFYICLPKKHDAFWGGDMKTYMVNPNLEFICCGSYDKLQKWRYYLYPGKLSDIELRILRGTLLGRFCKMIQYDIDPLSWDFVIESEIHELLELGSTLR